MLQKNFSFLFSVFQTAFSIMEKIDVNDTTFLAVAFYIKADAIWSDDIHFQKQSKFKVITTLEIVKLFQEKNLDDPQ